MTDRIHALTVTLREDMRDDDVKAVAMAIRIMSPVLAVHTHVSDVGLHVACLRAKAELREKLYQAINEFGKD